MSLKRSTQIKSSVIPARLDQLKYTGKIRETPKNHITLWVDDPVRRYTITFDPRLLEAKMLKYKHLLEVPESVAKKHLTKKQFKDLNHLIRCNP